MGRFWRQVVAGMARVPRNDFRGTQAEDRGWPMTESSGHHGLMHDFLSGLARREAPEREYRRDQSRRTRSNKPIDPANLARPTSSLGDLAVDLGAANTVVYEKGQGIVLNEPTVIARSTRTGEVIAAGDQAWQLTGRLPTDIVVERPLRHGLTADLKLTETTLRLVLSRLGRGRFANARLVLCVPSAMAEPQRRALREAVRQAGASSQHLIEQPLAAAIGSGLSLREPTGHMVVHLGAHATEAALISSGDAVATSTVEVGGFDLDTAIQAYIRTEYRLAVSERTAEEIKFAVGSAWPTQEPLKTEVQGRDLATGLHKAVILAPSEVRAAMDDVLREMIETIKICVSHAPPKLAADALAQGVLLVGGGALLSGLDLRIADAMDAEVRIAEYPLECAALGAGQYLEVNAASRSAAFKL